MLIDWEQLAVDIGSIDDATELSGTEFAQRAVEHILGKDNITAAVDLILAAQPGSSLAESVLTLISSEQALELAYQRYKTSTEDQAVRAVFLIKELRHSYALQWVVEFLNDPNVAVLGIDVLDQLVFSHAVDPDSEAVESVLRLAEEHPSSRVQEGARSIRAYLSGENSA